MLVTIILSIVLWAVGLFLASFGIIPLLIVLRVSIPINKRLARHQHIRFNKKIANKKASFTLIFWIIIDAIIIALVTLFVPDIPTYAFWIGFALSLLIGIGKTGKTPANLLDYWRITAPLIPEEDWEMACDYINDIA